jgi:hypothetical protein
MSFLIRTPMDKIKPYYSEAAKTHYTQLFQHFPFLERFYLPFEKNFHAEPCVNFAKATWPLLPLALCTAYALMIVVGTRVMKNREKFDWRTPLAYWNLCLSLFRFVRAAWHRVWWSGPRSGSGGWVGWGADGSGWPNVATDINNTTRVSQPPPPLPPTTASAA